MKFNIFKKHYSISNSFSKNCSIISDICQVILTIIAIVSVVIALQWKEQYNNKKRSEYAEQVFISLGHCINGADKILIYNSMTVFANPFNKESRITEGTIKWNNLYNECFSLESETELYGIMLGKEDFIKNHLESLKGIMNEILPDNVSVINMIMRKYTSEMYVKPYDEDFLPSEDIDKYVRNIMLPKFQTTTP